MGITHTLVSAVADDEDVLKLSSLLHEDDTKERIIQVFSALRDAIDGARAAEIERDSAPPPPPPPTDAERLERLAISLNDLVKMMAAPREIIRDESGRAIGIAPIYERGASGSIDEAIANISDGLDVLASPRELVRDPKTAKLRGLH